MPYRVTIRAAGKWKVRFSGRSFFFSIFPDKGHDAERRRGLFCLFVDWVDWLIIIWSECDD
jgi:hypothetical protein